MLRQFGIAVLALVALAFGAFAVGQEEAATPEGPYELSVSHWFGQPTLAAAVKDGQRKK